MKKRFKISQEDYILIKRDFERIDSEFALGLITVDDARVILSKLYSAVTGADSKKMVLEGYDHLETVK